MNKTKKPKASDEFNHDQPVVDHPVEDLGGSSSQDLLDQLQECEEKYRRALADYKNLEYRVEQDRIQTIKMANRWLLEELLEPLDFMETATKHIDDKGLKMVIDRFYQVLDQHGLEEIKVKAGDEFDESVMEVVETAKGEAGKVIEVRRKGFRLNGNVIRHTRVVVGK